MFRIKKYILCAASLLLFSSALTVHADSELIPADEIKADTVNYKTAEASFDSFALNEKTQGSVYFPLRTAVLYEGENARYVKSLVSTNDDVKAGQPIAKISVETDELLLTETELKLTRSKEDFETGKADREKELKELRTKYTTIADELERQKASLNIQRKEIELQKYTYEQERLIADQEKELEKLNAKNDVQYIYAPISGSVSDIVYFREGDLIRSGTEVCTIADLSVALVYAQAAFPYGSTVKLTTNVQKQSYELPGTVVVAPNVFSAVPSNASLIEVKLDELGISMDQLGMLRGRDFDMIRYARLNVEGYSMVLDNVLTIPQNTIVMEGGIPYVTIVDPDGSTTHKRAIQLGATNQKTAWVISGMKEGDKAVINK